MLEQLQPADQNYLMGALLHGPGQPMKAGVDRAVGVGATNQNLNLFADFVNELWTCRYPPRAARAMNRVEGKLRARTDTEVADVPILGAAGPR